MARLINVFRTRASNIEDIEIGLEYSLHKNIINYSKESNDIIKEADKELMKSIIIQLEKIENWTAIILESIIKDLIKKSNIKTFNILAPLRASLTGQKYSPSIYIILEMLGKEICIYRLKKVFLNT